MDLAAALQERAARLGLQLRWDSPLLQIRRDDWSLNFDATNWLATTTDDDKEDLSALAWLLLGIRLGLDSHIPAPEPEIPLHLRFRRAELRRYHEAPSFHGDHLPLLVPEITALAFERIAGEEAFRRPWILPGYHLLIYKDTGRRREILTVKEQDKSDDGDDDRWRKARTALFYDAYRLRPKERQKITGGELRFYESPDGMGGTRGLLLPEFDYDSARDGGFFAIPNRDSFIIASPHDEESAEEMLPELKQAASAAAQSSHFPISDALFQLHKEAIILHQEPTLDLRPLTSILLEGLDDFQVAAP